MSLSTLNHNMSTPNHAMSTPNHNMSTLPHDATPPLENGNESEFLTATERYNKLLVQRQSVRLLSVASVVFTDPLIKTLRDENKRLALGVKRVEKQLAVTEAILGTTMEHFLGANTFLIAIKNFNNTHLGARCNCPHCTRALMLPPLRQNANKLCTLFIELAQTLHAHEITFVCRLDRNGAVRQGLPPVPADFPPPGIAFDADTVSHLDLHLVFEQMGNPYDFKYGMRLWIADSPYHPELFKVHNLMRHMYQRDGY